ncbi:hypothetical protein L6452_01908 [Arctium lappa]|uniref:Uncharacterized protein n=1 Tax=Arctium lappa TaxID=4217 RepID=A0ACB9FI34_ARCLA|nr:hypothetical protein L6452_01908 [Arctium lappa]
MSPTYFPLRWESTNDQWWYASPIDWAAANGHYDLVRELLRLDVTGKWWRKSHLGLDPNALAIVPVPEEDRLST